MLCFIFIFNFTFYWHILFLVFIRPKAHFVCPNPTPKQANNGFNKTQSREAQMACPPPTSPAGLVLLPLLFPSYSHAASPTCMASSLTLHAPNKTSSYLPQLHATLRLAHHSRPTYHTLQPHGPLVHNLHTMPHQLPALSPRCTPIYYIRRKTAPARQEDTPATCSSLASSSTTSRSSFPMHL